MSKGVFRGEGQSLTHVKSLSIWSPKPGVSTTVREMRMPSSSSSASMSAGSAEGDGWEARGYARRTDSDRVDANSCLEVGLLWRDALLVLQDGLFAQRVDKGSPTGARLACCCAEQRLESVGSLHKGGARAGRGKGEGPKAARPGRLCSSPTTIRVKPRAFLTALRRPPNVDPGPLILGSAAEAIEVRRILTTGRGAGGS